MREGSAPRGDEGGRRVFVAGASGAVGRRLVPLLVEHGHRVTAMTRSRDKLELLRSAGAEPVLCDVFDKPQLERTLQEAHPEVVISQLTDLPREGIKPRKLSDYYARNDRVRREGTANLLAAAQSAGAARFIGQSIAFWYEPSGPAVKDEDDPLWRSAPAPIGPAVEALEHSEQAVLGAEASDGVVLRYGTFYGPGTWHSPDGDIGRQMRKRQYPIIGLGEGRTSFIHIDDAAAACVAFVDRGSPGVYNVADDEPATANEWMPAFAAAIGAKPPRRVPRWLARLIAGKAIIEWTTTARGASNEKLKRELGWQAKYPSWREGFSKGLS